MIMTRRNPADLPGQDMIYMAKEAEARAYLAGGTIGTLMSAEIGVTAPDAYQLAQTWMNIAALWHDVAARIEGERLRRIDAVLNQYVSPTTP